MEFSWVFLRYFLGFRGFSGVFLGFPKVFFGF